MAKLFPFFAVGLVLAATTAHAEMSQQAVNYCVNTVRQQSSQGAPSPERIALARRLRATLMMLSMPVPSDIEAVANFSPPTAFDAYIATGNIVHYLGTPERTLCSKNA